MLTVEDIKKRFRARDVSPYADTAFLESLALTYHENSKFSFWDAMQQGLHAESLNNPYINSRASKPYKVYPGAKQIPLDHYRSIESPPKSLYALLDQRRSTRDFTAYDISLGEIYRLLHYAYGITGRVNETDEQGNDLEWGWRVVPSAGGLYPLEVYVVAINAQLEKGLYHFRPDINALETLDTHFDLTQFIKASNASSFLNAPETSLAIVITGVFERTFIKYQERGYRFILQESGAVMQNLSVVSEALDLGSCIIGGFLDEGLNDLLGIDGVFESTLGVIYIGKK
jgi:SagB-type dehydrogenase family enzyme